MISISELKKFLSDGVSIIAADENGLLALNKPCGMLSHPNEGGVICKKSILKLPYDFSEQAYEIGSMGSDFDRKIFLLNRLDSPVSGVLLIALNCMVAEAVKSAFEDRTVNKQYVALVKGVPCHRYGVWKSRLHAVYSKKSSQSGSAVAHGENKFFSETRYEFIHSIKIAGITFSLLNLFPITGRTHQLRIHCSQNGLPIVGDGKYGYSRINKIFSERYHRSGLFLHSEKIVVNYDLSGKTYSFSGVSPCDFDLNTKGCIPAHIPSIYRL